MCSGQLQSSTQVNNNLTSVVFMCGNVKSYKNAALHACFADISASTLHCPTVLMQPFVQQTAPAADLHCYCCGSAAAHYAPAVPAVLCCSVLHCSDDVHQAVQPPEACTRPNVCNECCCCADFSCSSGGCCIQYCNARPKLHIWLVLSAEVWVR